VFVLDSQGPARSAALDKAGYRRDDFAEMPLRKGAHFRGMAPAGKPANGAAKIGRAITLT
jgi:hypothetical protein